MHILAVMGAVTGSTKPNLTEFQATDETIWSQVLSPTIDRPLSSYRLTTGGEAQKAEGDEGAALIYNRISTDYLEGGIFDTADYEAEFVVDSETGEAGTWSGSTRGSGTWHNLSTQRTWTWQKDTTNVGTAVANVTITIREIAVPANSVQASLTFRAEVADGS